MAERRISSVLLVGAAVVGAIVVPPALLVGVAAIRIGSGLLRGARDREPVHTHAFAWPFDTEDGFDDLAEQDGAEW